MTTLKPGQLLRATSSFTVYPSVEDTSPRRAVINDLFLLLRIEKLPPSKTGPDYETFILLSSGEIGTSLWWSAPFLYASNKYSSILCVEPAEAT